MRTRSLFVVSSLALVGLVQCGPAQPPAPPPQPSAVQIAPSASAQPPARPVEQTTLAAVGLDGTAIDRSIKPCQDFYEFACKGWIARTEIPADEARWSRSFSELNRRNEAALREILERAKVATNNQAEARLGNYYDACMDEAAVEQAGLKAIEPLLLRARKVASPKEVGLLIATLHAHRIWALFDLASAQDFKDATSMIANLDQNGLGLPDRDYYTKDDDKSKTLRKTYQEHVERMLTLGGMKPKEAKSAAEDVMAVETEIAKISKTKVERRDPAGMYNRINRDGLEKNAPAFPWGEYFKAIGAPELKDVNVTSVKFVAGMNELLKSVKLGPWRNYLQWQIFHHTARALPKRFVDEAFTLTKALTGQAAQKPRWKRCVAATDDAMGEALAVPFVNAHFAGESKTAAVQMVKAISEAFGRNVASLEWMDATTRERALSKRAQMAYLIGYPDKWKSYDFAIDPKNYAANLLAAEAFETKRDLAKVGKPVDRDEWQMSPPTVNAYYDPQRNHMVFPAGILQPPFYSVKAAVAVNLGAIGMVVGHELTHGFDDEGSQFDGKGNLENWWSNEVGSKFKAKTRCVAEQYSGYEPLPGLHVNGDLTLGENIADLGGLKLAFSAYRALRASAPSTLQADGFTEDQLFFLAHAQVWCSKEREEFVRNRVQTDPHSPSRFRVNGPLSNLPEFSAAFGCEAGTPLNPQKKCAVW